MKIAVAMSGGVDSSVTAYLLKMQGHEVIGITMRMDGSYEELSKTGLACADTTTASKARIMAEHLGIPLHEIDVSREFHEEVITYLKTSYLSGSTPNPCVKCNMTVKFGAFIKNAEKAGITFDKIATGHYAKILFNEKIHLYELHKGINKAKDQSYFLAMLSQKQLERVLFPLGDYDSKEEIWNIAEKAGLPFEEKKESQDFLSGNYLDAVGVKPLKGKIKLSNGKVLGTHDGFWHFTIGQRKGLGVSYSEPLFVTRIDPVTNTIFAGTENELYSTCMEASSVNWISGTPPPNGTIVNVKIRYRHSEVPCTIKMLDNGNIHAEFMEKQKSITSGQFAVFYDNDMALGGGVIL